MSGDGVEDSHGVPQPGDGEMGAHDEWTEPDRPDVGEDVLYGVGVDGDDSSGGSPLVVDLVNVLVEPGMVKQPVWAGGCLMEREINFMTK